MSKLTAFIVTVVVLLGLVAGCGPATPAAEEVVQQPEEATAVPQETEQQPTAVPEEPADEPTAEPEAEPVSIRMAVFILPQFMDYYSQKAEEFHELYPNITVVPELVGGEDYFVNMTVQLAAGTGSDIIFINPTVNFPQYAAAGFLLPLDDYAERDQFDWSDFPPGLVEAASYQGQLYAMPHAYHPGYAILFYNKNLFDAAGVEYPNDDWTYDDMMAAAEKLTVDTDGDGALDQFGWVPDVWRQVTENATYMASFGCHWLDDTKTKSLADSPECLEAIQYAVDHMDVAPPYTSDFAPEQFFQTGKGAMFVSGSWTIGPFRAAAEQGGWELGAAKIPIGPAGRRAAGATFDSHAITSVCEHPDEAWLFISWLLNEENVQDFADAALNMPARVSIVGGLAEADPLWAPAVDALAYTEPSFNRPANMRAGEMNSLIQGVMEGVWTGSKTPEAALEELHPKLQELLDEPPL